MILTQPEFSWPKGQRAAVSLSFDDARVSQVDVGLPILDKHNVKATFYLSPPTVPQRLEAWQRAVANGHEMGNHTLTHPCSANFIWSRANALEDYTLERMERELLDANAFIEHTFGVKPSTYGYCCGQKFVGRGEALQSYVPLIARHFVVGRGFRDETPNDPTLCDLAQATGVDSDKASFEVLRAWVDRAVEERGWLIFVSHDIGDFPRLAMQADVLDAVCRHCAIPANGVWIDTVATIGAYVRHWQKRVGDEPKVHPSR